MLFALMTHSCELVLSRSMVRSHFMAPSNKLTRSCWQALLPDMTHSINSKTFSGLGSLNSYGALTWNDSLTTFGSLPVVGSFVLIGSLSCADSFHDDGALCSCDSFS